MIAISVAAAAMARMWIGSSNTELNQPSDAATARDTKKPISIANPPIRGVGSVWTSRSRISGMIECLRLRRSVKNVAAKVTSAATAMIKR